MADCSVVGLQESCYPLCARGSKEPLRPIDESEDEETWSKKENFELIKRIRKALKKDDVINYQVRVSKLNWNAIQFKDYSATQCKNRWFYIEGCLRQYRLLAEVLEDAEKWVDDPSWYEFHQGVKRPSPPKPPTPFKLFSDEMLPKRLNQGMSSTAARERTRDAYKQLSDKQKLKWIYKAQEKEPEFNEEMDEYQRQHPDVELPAKKLSLLTKDEISCSRNEGRPKKPPTSGYSLFSKTLLSSNCLSKFETTERMKVIARRWKELSEEEQTKYNDRTAQLKTAYKMKYASYMETLTCQQRNAELPTLKSPERSIHPKSRRSAANADSKSAKSPSKIKPSSKGKALKSLTEKVASKTLPKPPVSPAAYYVMSHHSKLVNLSAAEIDVLWERVSKKQKEKFTKQLKKKNDEYVLELKKFRTLNLAKLKSSQKSGNAQDERDVFKENSDEQSTDQTSSSYSCDLDTSSSDED
ncbi:hypothetical protein DAPPUDRAFT_104634 [Daphnia pulex]|uniref:HMG box domain-containing protein n=1 Tax=Daphnia pulex TaxID=6669 RepID=E9GMV1_DAPPU|nr:hypothetical protein DAPPUDRAFT_104634 [Daphnia pulex]|eukprot:EFX79157.1 hypothetical protein DAPPUDRAFT_104634 [Daphnia pulex]